MTMLARLHHWIDERAPGVDGMLRKHAIALSLVLHILGLGLVGAGVTAEAIPAWFSGTDVTTRENAFGRSMLTGYFGFFAFLWICTRFGLERPRPLPQRVKPHS